MKIERMNPFLPPEHLLKRVPESELDIRFVRSSGPGGQKVNKTSSKAQLRWKLEDSPSFTPEEKSILRDRLNSRLTKEGEIVISSDQERSQLQNKEAAIQILQNLVSEALTPRKERKATKPTNSSKERRLDEKTKHGARKRERRVRFDE